MMGVYALRMSVAFMSCAQEMNALRMISVVMGSTREGAPAAPFIVVIAHSGLMRILPIWSTRAA
jgi:hypothetical protein